MEDGILWLRKLAEQLEEKGKVKAASKIKDIIGEECNNGENSIGKIIADFNTGDNQLNLGELILPLTVTTETDLVVEAKVNDVVIPVTIKAGAPINVNIKPNVGAPIIGVVIGAWLALNLAG